MSVWQKQRAVCENLCKTWKNSHGHEFENGNLPETKIFDSFTLCDVVPTSEEKMMGVLVNPRYHTLSSMSVTWFTETHDRQFENLQHARWFSLKI